MDWMQILNDCLDVILPAVCSVIVILLGVVGSKIKNAYEKRCKDDTSKQVVNDVVQFVEQVYKDLKGDEKLQKALTRASTILNEKGITISEAELNMLIESAVYGLNKGLSGEQIEKEEQKVLNEAEENIPALEEIETEHVEHKENSEEVSD